MKSGKNRSPLLLRIVQKIYPLLERTLPCVAHRFFVTIFFSPLNYAVPEKEKDTEKKAEKFIIRSNGKKIQCYSWGQGPVVLVVHGWAGRATQFRKIIAALVRENYRVVGFDGPAHGRSQGRSTNIAEFELVLAEIYRHVGVPAGIIAHSFGGGAVLSAAMNGLPVQKLINIASPTIGDEIIGTYLRTINGSESTARFFKSYVLRTTGKPFEEFTGLHFIRNLKHEVDLLLVHDEDDAEVPLRHAVELIQVYPRATLYQTRGLGHTRILRDEDVIRTCIAFLKT